MGRARQTTRALTARAVEAAKLRDRDYWLTDATTERGTGRLVLRVGTGGSKRWYFKVEHEGRRDYLPIGDYAPPARPGATPGGLSLDDARDEARKLANLHRAHGDVRGHLNAERAAREATERATREREARERDEAARLKLDAKAFTLRRLCAAYADHLQRQGKISAADVRNTFANHLDAQPIADKVAREVQARDISAVLRAIVEQGKGRTAAKLRAYLAAAFAMAARAESDSTVPSAMLAFNVTADPMASVAARGFAQFSKALDRTLTLRELHAYWRRVHSLDGIQGDGLRLHALLGGQRIVQLLRATVADFDADAKVLTLRDPKGRRKEPRLHAVPLVGLALGIVQRLADERRAYGWHYLLGCEPDTHTRPETLDKAFAQVREAMRAAGELDKGVFQLRDLRRTVETMLAGEGVSMEVRAHLQSHGLGGVQTRHYVKHDFLAEKRAALLRWHRLLGLKVAAAAKPKAGNVLQLASVKRARGA